MISEVVSIKNQILDENGQILDQSYKVKIEQPEGGWYVTPVHASLLPRTGEVLLTGWGRKQEYNCRQDSDFNGLTMGLRRYGVSFVWNPESSDQQSLLVTPISEQHNRREREFENQVLYCSGHIPLENGDILYTGGSKYKNLARLNAYKIEDGVSKHDKSKMEIEFGLDYSTIFDSDKKQFLSLARDALTYESKLGPEIDGKHYNTMWYPTNTRLWDGKVMTIGGFYRYGQGENANRSIQLFDHKAWECRRGGQSTGDCANHRKVWLPLVAHKHSPLDLKPGSLDYIHSLMLYEPVNTDGRSFQLAMTGFSGHWYLFDSRMHDKELDAYAEETTSQRFFPKPVKSWDELGKSSYYEAPNKRRGDQWSSSSLLLPTGEILTFGGSHDRTVASRVDLFNPYFQDETPCKNYKDLGVNTSCKPWRYFHTYIPRNSPSVILLPNGQVMIAGGWNDRNPALAVDPQLGLSTLNMQIIDPRPKGDELVDEGIKTSRADDRSEIRTISSWQNSKGQTWEKNSERGYHNIAIALKDGSVLIGGGTHSVDFSAGIEGGIGCEQPSIQRYRPWYFNKQRPAIENIDSSLAKLKLGSDTPLRITIDSPKNLYPSITEDARFGYSGLALLAPGSFTHSFNQNQRYIPLRYEKLSDREYLIYPPKDGYQAPPGEYLLHATDVDLVPSKGVYVKIDT